MTKDEMLREIAGSAVSYDALDYVEVQITKSVWAELKAMRRAIEPTADPARCTEPNCWNHGLHGDGKCGYHTAENRGAEPT